jgi:hypothetical protein
MTIQMSVKDFTDATIFYFVECFVIQRQRGGGFLDIFLLFFLFKRRTQQFLPICLMNLAPVSISQ